MKQKTHSVSPARQVALHALERVFSEGKTLMESLPLLEDERIQPQDRALAREIVSGTCRMWGRLRFILIHFAPRFDQFPATIQRILELSLYQLIYLERVPHYAVLSEAVELAKSNRLKGLAPAVNGILRNYQRNPDSVPFPRPESDFVEYLAVEYSHPRWLIECWLKRWSQERVEALCAWNNTRAPVSLRLRGEIATALSTLEREGVTYTIDDRFPNRVTLNPSENVSPKLLRSPHWVVQDGAAMLVSHLVNPQPGWRVWDVCAAPGGKTFHLADLVQCQAHILASDRSGIRLEKLVEQRGQLGLSCIETRTLDVLSATQLPDSFKFNSILVDAPCTGWGTFRRHPDLRWRLQPEDPERLGQMALEMLTKVHSCLKDGGILIYSTCTLSLEENEKVVMRFLESNTDYTLENAGPYLPYAFNAAVTEQGFMNVFPVDWRLDGTFAARLRKGGRHD